MSQIPARSVQYRVLTPYEAVAEGLNDSGESSVTAAQVEAAIGQTSAGTLSDSFWAAWDAEVGRLMDFFLSVKDEPVVQERMEAAR